MSFFTQNFKNTNHIFIIAEAGSNWKVDSYKQDVNRAKKLIRLASKSGADAIKFQIYRPSSVYVSNAGKSNYLKKSGLTDNVFDIFKKHSMPYEMIAILHNYCEKQKILFMATPFSVADAKAINKFVKIHKIASFEINHIRLLEYLATTKKPIILSTGASDYNEIDFAVKLLKKNGTKEIYLLQTTSKYPAPLESLNLMAISSLKKKYNLVSGFSDHSTDPICAPLISIGLGAKIIEKHFTLDRNLEGPDHSFALNPDELKLMTLTIRKAEKMLGDGKKIILKEEKELKLFAKRYIQSIKNIEIGEKFVENENFGVLRPGNKKPGIDARFLNKVIGKKSKRKIKIGEGIHLTDLS